MLLGRSIKNRLVFYTLLVMVVVYVLSVGYTTISLREKAIKDANNLAGRYASQLANDVKARMNEDLGIARAMAYSISQFPDSAAQREDYIFNAMAGILENEERYYSTWVSLELEHFEPSWNKSFGRKRFLFYRQGDPAVDSVNLEGDDEGSLYWRLKKNKKEEISDPYYSDYTDETDVRNNVFGTSVCVPILLNNKFAGLAGMDMPLNSFEYIAELKPFEQSNIFLVSNNSTIVSSSDFSLQGKGLEEILSNGILNAHKLKDKIAKGVAYDFKLESEESELVVIAPVELGNSELPWAIGIIIPEAVIMKEVNYILLNVSIIACLGLLLFAVVIWKTAVNITLPLQNVSQLIKQISYGNIDLKNQVKVKSNDEIGEISLSANQLIQTLIQKEAFAKAIGEGNFNVNYQPLSEQDSLGNSLLVMRQNLRTSKLQEEQRNWVSTGLTKFAEMLRLTNENHAEFYQKVVSELVKYVEANQAGLFLLNDEEDHSYLELVAAYAYERRKYIQKRIEIGEGILGQCFLEKDTLFLTDIPESYVKITSGLGSSNPSNLVLIPLKTDEEVIGIIEFASFQVLEEHKVKFLEKVAEILAATIGSLKISLKTSSLLIESQEQSEEMKAQEEEMRQSMEELEATQEEMRRAQQIMDKNILILNGLINAAGDSVVVFDQNFNIVLINEVLSRRYAGTSFEMKIGDNLADKLGDQRDYWVSRYQKALNGEVLQFTIKSKLEKEDVFRQYNIVPVKNNEGEILYAVVISREVKTENILQELQDE